MKANGSVKTSDGNGRKSTGCSGPTAEDRTAQTKALSPKTQPYDPPPGEPELPPRRPNFSRREWDRWMTYCQHHQIPPSDRPAAAGSVTTAGKAVQKILDRLDLGVCFRQWSMESQWNELVGRPLSLHCRPGALQDGKLTLYVSNSTWLYEIQRHLAGPLLQKIRTAWPDLDLRELTIRMDPGRAPGEARKPHQGASSS